MISVLTLTYKRFYLLEEAIESYLRQDYKGESEMVIINDNPKVEYVFEHPKIRIINLKERFQSLGHKLNFGFNQCKYDYIYRLDDDDLLAPWALCNIWEDITLYPDYEIYRSNGLYLFEHNEYKGIKSNINNGNVYTKKFLSRIEIPLNSISEDYAMICNFNAKIYESNREQKTMLYRWGMDTYHISGMGQISVEARKELTDHVVENISKGKNIGEEEGLLLLHPHFDEEYYQQISK